MRSSGGEHAAASDRPCPARGRRQRHGSGCRSENGQFAVMACRRRELGYAGVKSYAWTMTGPVVVLLFSLEHPTRLEAVIEADKLGQLRTARSGVADATLRESLVRPRVIGCGAGGFAGGLHPGRRPLARTGRCLLRDLGPSCRVSPRERLHTGRAPSRGCRLDIVVTGHHRRIPCSRRMAAGRCARLCGGANDPARRELDNRCSSGCVRAVATRAVRPLRRVPAT